MVTKTFLKKAAKEIAGTITKCKWLEEVSYEIKKDESWKQDGDVWKIVFKTPLAGQEVDTVVWVWKEEGKTVFRDIHNPHIRRALTIHKHPLTFIAEVIATILITRYFEIVSDFVEYSLRRRDLWVSEAYISCIYAQESAWWASPDLDFTVTADIERETKELILFLYSGRPDEAKEIARGNFPEVRQAFEAFLLQSFL